MLSYFVIGSFRSPVGNTLSALKKVKLNLIIVIVTGFLNIGLDYFLIIRYGMNGAAFTSLTVASVSALMCYLFFTKTINTKPEKDIFN